MAQHMSDLAPLRAELKQWRAEGRRARFWLRDDDLTQMSPRVEAMVAVLERFGIRALLAIIPGLMADGLANALPDRSRYVICQHGLRHTNHEAADAPKAEFGGARSAAVAVADIGEGQRLMHAAFGASFAPIFVPPWNRMATGLRAGLIELGFQGLSAYGNEKAAPSGAALAVVNADIDVLNWAEPDAQGVAVLPLADICRRAADLLSRRRRSDPPSTRRIGFLTHHLAMDSAAWEVVSIAIAETLDAGVVDWVDPGELFGLAGHAPQQG